MSRPQTQPDEPIKNCLRSMRLLAWCLVCHWMQGLDCVLPLLSSSVTLHFERNAVDNVHMIDFRPMRAFACAQ